MQGTRQDLKLLDFKFIDLIDLIELAVRMG